MVVIGKTVINFPLIDFKITTNTHMQIRQMFGPRTLIWAETDQNKSLANDIVRDMSLNAEVVGSKEEFISGLVSGQYNVYVLLDRNLSMTSGDETMLKNEVFRGKGLVSIRDGNKFVIDPSTFLGVRYRGLKSSESFTVSFQPDSIFQENKYTGLGSRSLMEVASGRFQGDTKGVSGTVPAAATFTYGNGKTTTFSFDVGQLGISSNAVQVIAKAIEYVAPISSIPSELVEVEIQLQSTSEGTLNLLPSLPSGATIQSTNIPATINGMYSVHVAVGEQTLVRFKLFVPASVRGQVDFFGSFQGDEGMTWNEEVTIGVNGTGGVWR
jgi:hypothetical protein